MKYKSGRFYKEWEFIGDTKEWVDISIKRNQEMIMTGKAMCTICASDWRHSADGKRQGKHRRKIFNGIKGTCKPWIYPVSCFHIGVLKLCASHRKVENREAIIDRATPSWANQQKIASIYVEARNQGKQVDHIIPLKGKLVSGLHVETNLQIITKDLNLWKSNKLFEHHANGS